MRITLTSDEPREAELWEKQLAAINKIHRSPDGREMNLYAIRNGKSDFPCELCFGKDGEFKIAVVDLVGLHIMRLKPKWGGTIIVVLSMIAYYAIFYGSEDRNNNTTKTWLWVIFAVGFFGGLLAFMDSLVQLRRAKKQGDKDVQEK